MKAMLLAAGEGRRMRPLTLNTPKPLLAVAGKPLIVHHLEAIKRAGVDELVINVAYLGEQIVDALGSGDRWGLTISYSREQEPLETAGGILNAERFLGEDPFLLVSSDIWTDMPFDGLIQQGLESDVDAKLFLVNNPEHHPSGDYDISDSGYLQAKTKELASYTYSGVAIIRLAAVKKCPTVRRRFPLREVFADLIQKNRISAEHYGGDWLDVGTPERLQKLDGLLSSGSSGGPD